MCLPMALRRLLRNVATTVSIAAGITAFILLLFVKYGNCDDGLGYTDTPRLPNSPWRVHDRQRPQPPMVVPGDFAPSAPPADALVLFDGNDLSQWEGGDSRGIANGCINILKTGQIQTKKRFGDCQLHVEWRTPAAADGNRLNWGNSGVFMLGKYELQIIESHDSKIYADGIAGAIYGQTPPLVNAARKPGQWQSYDIVFTAPRFDGDRLAAPAYFTVFWNGVLVQNHTASLGPMKYRAVATYDSRETVGPITLQEHGSAVQFRNIWVRPLQRNGESAWPFFAFGNGAGGMKVPFDRQAKMLKELGYDGIAHDGIERTDDMLKALDAQGLKMLSIYAGVSVAPGTSPYPAELKTAIEQLKGRDVQIWLTVGGGIPATAENDARAVAIFREIADMADRAGLQVALYPHFGAYVATIDDALRLVKKTDRKNLGLCFNLCHFLKCENQETLTEKLKAALPHLLAVNINGADGGATNAMNWDRLIQTLDRGSFDVGDLLKTLQRLGYSGPIGLQCFAIPGDSRENLARSITAWRKMSATTSP